MFNFMCFISVGWLIRDAWVTILCHNSINSFLLLAQLLSTKSSFINFSVSFIALTVLRVRVRVWFMLWYHNTICCDTINIYTLHVKCGIKSIDFCHYCTVIIVQLRSSQNTNSAVSKNAFITSLTRIIKPSHQSYLHPTKAQLLWVAVATVWSFL